MVGIERQSWKIKEGWGSAQRVVGVGEDMVGRKNDWKVHIYKSDDAYSDIILQISKCHCHVTVACNIPH